MHILFLSWQWNPYFYGGNDLGTALALHKKGHKVTILVTRPVFAPAPPVPKNLPITFKHVRMPNIKLPPLFWRTNNLFMRLKITALLWFAIRRLVDYQFRFWLWRHSPHPYDIIQCCDFLHLPEWIVRQGTPAVVWFSTPCGRRWQATLHRLANTQGLGIFTHGTSALGLEAMGFLPGKDFAVIPPGIHPPDKTLLTPQHKTRQRETLMTNTSGGGRGGGGVGNWVSNYWASPLPVLTLSKTMPC